MPDGFDDVVDAEIQRQRNVIADELASARAALAALGDPREKAEKLRAVMLRAEAELREKTAVLTAAFEKAAQDFRHEWNTVASPGLAERERLEQLIARLEAAAKTE